MEESLGSGFGSQMSETIQPRGPVEIELGNWRGRRVDAKAVWWAVQLVHHWKLAIVRVLWR
jgi:hypothetical protein